MNETRPAIDLAREALEHPKFLFMPLDAWWKDKIAETLADVIQRDRMLRIFPQAGKP